MANYTPNLNLEKPLQSEFYNVDIFNANADKIDTAIGNISTNTYQKPTGGIPLVDVSSQITDRLDWYGTATGIGNLILNIPEFVGTLKAGAVLRFKANSGGTGSFTLNFNGNGAKRINRSNGSQLNRIDTGGIYTVVYDGTNFILQGEGGEYGTAVASDVLQGKTIGTENGLVAGSIINRSDASYTITTPGRISIPSGYYNGQGGVTANYPMKRRYVTSVNGSGTGTKVPIIWGFQYEYIEIFNNVGARVLQSSLSRNTYLGGGDYITQMYFENGDYTKGFINVYAAGGAYSIIVVG